MACNCKTRALLIRALYLRMWGENAPGGDDSWEEWDKHCEAYLRLW